jgi:hypothetical protein
VQARGETAPVALAPQPDYAPGDFALHPLDLLVQSDSVEAVIVTSELLAADEPVGAVQTLSRTVLQEPPPTLSLAPDTVVARAGERIALPSPHTSVLPPGIYVEQIRITVLDRDYDAPVDTTALRFFRMTGSGLAPLSSTEYSDLLEPPFVVADPTGHPIPARAGTLRLVPEDDRRPTGMHLLQDLASQERGDDHSETDED